MSQSAPLTVRIDANNDRPALTLVQDSTTGNVAVFWGELHVTIQDVDATVLEATQAALMDGLRKLYVVTAMLIEAPQCS